MFGFLKRKPKAGEAIISAVITRADGTVEDLGVIAEGDVLIIPETE